MLAKDPDLASRMASNLHRLVETVGVRSKVAKARLAEIEVLFKDSGQREGASNSDREKAYLGAGRPARAHAARSSKH